MPQRTPLTGGALAALIAARARELLEAGTPIVRVGVDGAVERDASDLADAVCAELTSQALPGARIHGRDFLRARSLRLEWGRDDPGAYHDGWYDVAALRREVLDPLGPGGSLSWLARLRDPVSDRPYREPRRAAAPGTVAVLDGRFLCRPDLRAGLDLVVHLDVSVAARTRRLPADEPAGLLPAWQRYLRETGPTERAEIVVSFEHPDRPALVRADLSATPPRYR